MVESAESNEDFADIQASLAGDEDAYWRIVERYGLAIQRQVRNFTRNVQEIEELTQDVFVEAFFGLNSFRGDAPFLHWLSRICTRVGYRFWKNKGKKKNQVSLDHIPDVCTHETVEFDPELALEILFSMFATLPEKDRLAMTLKYLEKCSYEEIGLRIGCSADMVAVRVCRAKKKLRKLGECEPWKGKLACLI